MSGRNSADTEIRNRINRKLNEMPDFITGYYRYIRTSEASYCYEEIMRLSYFLRFINPNMKEVTLSDITADVAADYLFHKQEIEKVSPAYWNGLRGNIERFFDFLVEEGVYSSNPIPAKVKKRKNQRVVERKPALTTADLDNILEGLKNGVCSFQSKGYQNKWKERDLLIFNFFILTGVRKSALASIDITDIDFETGTLTVMDKGDKNNHYKINSLMPSLKSWMTKRQELITKWSAEGCELSEEDKNALFLANRKKRMSVQGITHLVEKVTEEILGEKYSPHKIRYAFGTNLYEKTQDIYFVQKALHHSDAGTTQIYIRQNQDSMDEIDSIMGEVVKNCN